MDIKKNTFSIRKHIKTSKQNQVSETIRLGMILAISGGLMDAYSYLQRDQVFANAQTGNMLLFGVNLSEGRYEQAMRYFFPVLAFALGITLTEFIRAKESGKLHWRQIAVLIEAVILAGVAFIPLSGNLNLLANSLTSFACGIQVESFRKIHGNGIATTMCIGNMRSGTEHLCHFLHKRERKFLNKAMLYYGIIFSFVIGAVIGNFCIKYMGTKAIIVSSIMLVSAFFFMAFDEDEQE